MNFRGTVLMKKVLKKIYNSFFSKNSHFAHPFTLDDNFLFLAIF